MSHEKLIEELKETFDRAPSLDAWRIEAESLLDDCSDRELNILLDAFAGTKPCEVISHFARERLIRKAFVSHYPNDVKGKMYMNTVMWKLKFVIRGVRGPERFNTAMYMVRDCTDSEVVELMKDLIEHLLNTKYEVRMHDLVSHILAERVPDCVNIVLVCCENWRPGVCSWHKRAVGTSVQQAQVPRNILHRMTRFVLPSCVQRGANDE